MQQSPLTESELIAEIERLGAECRSIVQHRPPAEPDADRRARDRQVDDIKSQIEFLRGPLERA
jgi:hypothetical protein